MKLTQNEIIVLRAIVENEFQDCGPINNFEDAIGNPIWMIQEWDVRFSDIKGKMLSGICSSLSKKGLMGTQGTGKKATCWITQEGYDAVKSYL